LSWLRRLAPAAVTLALLALLIRQLARQGGSLDVRAALAGIAPAWVAVGVLLFLVVNVLRAVRFRLLIPAPGVGTVSFMPVGFALSFLNNILPLRGGELAFVVAMRSGYGVPAVDSAAALLLARMLDYLAVAAWFVPLAFLSLDRLPPISDWPVPNTPTVWLIGTVIAFMAVLAVLVASLAGLGQRAVRAMAWGLDRLGQGARPVAVRLVDFGSRSVHAFEALRTGRTYAAAFGLTLLLWLGIFAWQYSFARGLGLRVEPGAGSFDTLGFGLFVIGATFGTLSKAIPVPTMGGHGIIEVGWTLGFTLVGIPVATAIASSLGITVLTLLVSTIFGIPMLGWLELRRRQLAQRAARTP